MVRNKSTTSVKHHSEDDAKILSLKLPSVNQPSYASSNVVLADVDYLKQCLQEDVILLQADLKFRLSC